MLWPAEASNTNIGSSEAAARATATSSNGVAAAAGQSSWGTSSSSSTRGTSKSSIVSCWTTSDADFGMARVSSGTGMNVARHLLVTGMNVAEASDGLILNNAAGSTTDALNLAFQPSLVSPSPVSNDGTMAGFTTSYPIRNTTSLGTQEFLVNGATNENSAATTSAFDNEAAAGTVGSSVVLTPAALPAAAAAAATQPATTVNSATSQALQGVQVSSTGVAPVSSASMQQQKQQLPHRPVNPPSSQPIICVPNQQAQYPHVQSQGRVGKGPVVKHMTTAPATQRTPHLQQHAQHVHKFQQKPGGGVQVQTQVASQGRQVQHQMVANQRYMQVGSSRSYIPSGHLPGRMQHPQMQSHSQKPLQMPRSMPAGVMGQMSASASPHMQHQAKASGVKHAQVNTMSNGHFVGGKLCPMYLSQLQGSAGENHLCRDRMADRVSVSDRKVRLVSENDPSSLYALCRRWVRNDTPRKEHIGYWDGGVQLPRPLSAEEVERTCKQNADPSSEVEPEYAVDESSESELLQHHIRHFKNVRKRSRDQRTQKIARYKDRLQMLLPPSL